MWNNKKRGSRVGVRNGGDNSKEGEVDKSTTTKRED